MESNFCCSTCGENLRVSEGDHGVWVSCAGCAFTRELSATDVRLKVSDMAVAAGVESVAAREWWHATCRPEWLKTLKSSEEVPLVHLGSKEAAVERGSKLRKLKKYAHEEWVLLKVRVKEVTTDPVVHADNFFPEGRDLPKTTADASYPCYRYVNACEDVGSISLLVVPEVLTVEDQQALTS